MRFIRPLLLLTLAALLPAQQKVFPGADDTTPSRAQYFSWINNTNEGSTEAQTFANLEFFQWLHDEYGMVLDIYAFDAGNIDGPRISGSMQSDLFHKQFPHGFGPIQQKAAGFGARLGVWLGPDGFGNTAEQERARTETLVSLCRDFHFELFKIDAVGGQLRPEKQDAFIRMMTECRKYSPDLILLNHRLQLGKALPYATTFLWEGYESYIDVHMPNRTTALHHRAGALTRGLVPEMKRLTEDHGVCLSSALDFWDDELVLQAFSRSLILAPEIYGNPWFLRDDEFPKLARIYNLHRRYGKILVNGMRLPEEQYGPNAVSRGDGNTRLIALKNLTWNPVKYRVKLGASVGLAGEGTVELRRLHPSEMLLGRFPNGTEVEVEVLPFRSSLLIASMSPIAEVGVDGSAYEIERDTPGKPVIVKLLGMPGTTARISVLPGGRKLVSAQLDGTPEDALAKGEAVPVRFPGKPQQQPWHRKLGELSGIPVPVDAEAIYEATCFAADSNALEVRSLLRSGPTRIPQVAKARQAFLDQPLFAQRGIWDRNLFDGDPNTTFNARRPGGILRVDFGRVTDLDRIVIRLGMPNPQALADAKVFGNQPPSVSAGPISVDWAALKADASADLSHWTAVRLRGEQGAIVAALPKALQVRYLRVFGAPRQIAEIEGYRGAEKLDRAGWRASNLLPPYSPAVQAWQLRFRIQEAPEGSYFAIALPGQYGKEGAYATIRVGDRLVGAPDRAVSYPANPWEYSNVDADSNYTYYIPVTPDMVGKELEVVALAFQKTEMTPAAWITAYPIPYVSRRIVLSEK
jgi:hypothetical protein